jgi:hypothetical protein
LTYSGLVNPSVHLARDGFFFSLKETLTKRQFDVGLISPFGPREARPKRRKIIPRAE